MHDLHIIVTTAESAEEAMEKVEAHIAGWGDENNWHTVFGAVAEDGTWHVGAEASRHYDPCTLGELNAMLAEAVRTEPDDGVARSIALLAAGDIQALFAGSMAAAYVRIDNLRAYLGRLHGIYSAGLIGRNTGVSVFDVEFMPREYAGIGITRLEPDTAAGSRYAVLVDMHS